MQRRRALTLVRSEGIGLPVRTSVRNRPRELVQERGMLKQQPDRIGSNGLHTVVDGPVSPGSLFSRLMPLQAVTPERMAVGSFLLRLRMSVEEAATDE